MRRLRDASPSHSMSAVSSAVHGVSSAGDDRAVDYALDSWDHPVTVLPSRYAVSHVAQSPSSVLRDAVVSAVSAGRPSHRQLSDTATEGGDINGDPYQMIQLNGESWWSLQLLVQVSRQPEEML